jgi:hypothetical protein
VTQRAKAFETDDDALRCYLDQLPVDRCLFCATPTDARPLRVEGPVHTWTETNELADSESAGDRLMAAGRVLARRPGRAYSQQTKGTAWMAVCAKCHPSPRSFWIAGAVIAGVAVVLGALGQIWPTVLVALAAMVALGLASKRAKLRVGEIDEDDFMFKIRGVDEGVKREVLALGAAPNPNNRGSAELRG